MTRQTTSDDGAQRKDAMAILRVRVSKPGIAPVLSRGRGRSSLRRTLATLCIYSLGASADAASAQDLTQLSLEVLAEVRVYSASKFVQKLSEAPSNVTVITAADIKAYGYRKVIDILRSIPGLYTTYDRNYDFLGVRGFERPGDFNSRVLLLLDGIRLNENVYNQAALGTEFIVDVDLIDRVEFVPGPGSSIYG